MVIETERNSQPLAEPPLREESQVVSPLRFLWLIGLFFVGFLLVVGLNKLFSGLADELGQQSANERARLFIGEEVVRNIQGIEMDVYRMAMAVGPAAQEKIERELLKKVTKLERDLMVLKEGGTIQQLIYLNLEGMDQMIREVTFRPDLKDRAYIMEIIEIGPHLDQIKIKTSELKALLALRDDYRSRQNGEGMIAVSNAILSYFKRLPPFFFRLNENANRLFFESQHQLQSLDARLSAQRDRYKTTETVLVLLVVASVTLIGFLFARQIRQSNQKLVRAWNEMRCARDQAERASRAKSDFVSRMSHELRTPLNAILGFAQLLDKESLSPVQRNYSWQIRVAGQHLLELVGDVLDLAKIEAGHLVLEQVAFDPKALLDEVVSVMMKRAKIKGLELKAVRPSALPDLVKGDPTRLRQILINLLDNAVKFTECGSVGIAVESASEDSQWRFQVWDTGIGMEEKIVEKLFKPFTQADESTTRKYGGTGLGLVICKDLVAAMGGNLQVASEPDRGARFWFSLRLERADLAPEAAEMTDATGTKELERPATKVGEGQRKSDAALKGRVLLVEDNPVNQLVASSMVAALGATCDVAGNGLEALEKVQRGNRYDLIFMDVEMPIMDGHAATQEIRLWERRQGRQRIPIIAMTANAMAEDRQRCIASGMDDYLAKPYEMDALAMIVDRWL
ncbi:MAG: response regulator [Candidatus Competibacteraceae bacterium]|nr:response regulator [Candidatus Competibacteraceae bacterium]